MRAVVNGAAGRYFYDGDQVLEETNDSNGTLARYATASPSYYAPLLQFKRSDSSIRYPMMDIVGTTCSGYFGIEPPLHCP